MAFDLDAANEEKQRISYEKIKYVKLGPGKHVLRILPPPAGMNLPWKKYIVARDVGPNKCRVVPPHQYDPSLPNPLDDEIERLKGLGDEASLQRAKDMRPKTEYAMWVIKRGEERLGPQLWTATKTQVNQILAWRCDPENGDITDPEKGLDIKIEGAPAQNGKKGTEYTYSLSRKESPLGNDDWLETNYFEKFKVGRPSDVEYIEAAIAGTEKEYLARKRVEREAQRNTGPQEEPEVQDTAQVPETDAGVQAKLDEIRNRGKVTAGPKSEVRQSLDNMLS